MEKQVFELICFMITSARGCVEEPKLYGPLRLLDSTTKIIEILEPLRLVDEYSVRFKNKISEATSWVTVDRERFIDAMDKLVLELAERARELRSKGNPREIRGI